MHEAKRIRSTDPGWDIPQPGDVVRLLDPGHNDDRVVGTVTGNDLYHTAGELVYDCLTGYPELLAEVLWDAGRIGWILAKRLEVISETR